MPITPLFHFETCTLTAQRHLVWKTSSTERVVGNFTKNEKRIALSFKVAVPTICGSAIPTIINVKRPVELITDYMIFKI